jgi:hypothetical protein
MTREKGPTMADERETEYETEQENAAAAEAGAIGGRVSSEPPTAYEEGLSEADRPVSESGGGESEGFELAEMELIEHASHGDEHSAGRVLEDAGLFDQDEESSPGRAVDGEADEASPADA